jgi:hypothetical protein
MRTRWMLAASILVLLVTVAPGALRAAEEPGCAAAALTTVMTASLSVVVNVPSPATTTLPFWDPALASSQQTPPRIDEPIFIICNSTNCPPLRCSSLHNCVLAGCCH